MTKETLDLIDRLNRVRDAVLVGEMALHSDVFETQEQGALAAHLLKIIDDLEALRDEFSNALGIKPDLGAAHADGEAGAPN